MHGSLEAFKGVETETKRRMAV